MNVNGTHIIRLIGTEDGLAACAEVIRRSFAAVADVLGITAETVPAHPAFIDSGSLVEAHNRGVRFFGLFDEGRQIGCVAVERDAKGISFIKRLSVLPECRRSGYGKSLLDHAAGVIREMGGNAVSIAMVEDDRALKRWYLDYGFREKEVREFPHLPFRVCFMEKPL